MHNSVTTNAPFSLETLREAALACATPDKFDRLSKGGALIGWAGMIEMHISLEERGTWSPDTGLPDTTHFWLKLGLDTSFGRIDFEVEEITVPASYTPAQLDQFVQEGADLMREMILDLTDRERFSRAIGREILTLSSHLKKAGELANLF